VISADTAVSAAFIDESVRAGSGGLRYVVAAGAVLQADRDRARDELRKLLLPRQRYLHWNSEKAARRLAILDRLSGFVAMALACSSYPVGARRQERARADCLTALVGDLKAQGITELVIETRGEVPDRRDRRTLLHARDAGIAASDLNYRHVGKLEEPLLWAADAIAGAVALHLTGEDSRYFEQLRMSLFVHRLGP
jgi:Protein of unknown function (DUF3800)